MSTDMFCIGHQFDERVSERGNEGGGGGGGGDVGSGNDGQQPAFLRVHSLRVRERR